MRSPLSWPKDLLRHWFQLPDAEIPEGRWLELPRRGRTWLTDLPGPTPDAPAVVLLHAVGCTGLLTWFPVSGRAQRAIPGGGLRPAVARARDPASERF